MSWPTHHVDNRAHQHADIDATQRPHFEKSPQELRIVLQDAASKQETLARSRENLLIERQRLISSRNQVRAKRLETRDVEAGLMSCLRNLMNDVQQKVPASLLESYNRVDTLRNELGILEEQFLIAERKFAGSEWGFMDEENDFYQFELLDIIENAVSISASPLHDHEQVFASTGPGSELLNPGTTAVPATCPYSSAGYTLGGGGFVRSDNHVPPPPPFLLHAAQSHSPELAEEQCNEGLPPDIHQPSQYESTGTGLRDYHTIMDELEALRWSFETLRQERADVLDAIEDDPESVSNLPSISSENDNTAQLAAAAIEQQPWFQILQQISDREIEAAQLKNKAMFNDIQLLAITRRYSDPTSFANAAPTPSNFMGRALTETAVPMLSNNPGGKGRLREWLLAQLKEDPLQRRMYRNILMCEGLQIPVDETWESRASLYWDINHASDGETETIDSYDEDDEYTVTRTTSHNPSAISFSNVTGYQANPSSPLHNMQGKLEPTSAVSTLREATISPVTVLPRTREATVDPLASGQGSSQDLVLLPGEQVQDPDDSWSFDLSQRFETDVTKMGVTGKISKQHASYLDLSAMKEPLPSPNIPTIVATLTDEEARMQEKISCLGLAVEAGSLQQQVVGNDSEGVCCSNPLSEVVLLRIEDAPKLRDGSGDDKLPQRRLTFSHRLLSGIGHHRRTRSAPFGNQADHDFGYGRYS